MRSTVAFVATAVAAFLARPAAATLPNACLQTSGVVPADSIDAGTLRYGSEWNCGKISAPRNEVRTVTMDVDKTTLVAPTGGAVKLQIVFWNIQASYEDPTWKKNQWNTEQAFWVATPGTQRDALNRPWALPNTVQPSVANSWSVKAGVTEPDAVTVATSLVIDDLCEGRYTAIISAKGLNGNNTLNKATTAGILWRIVEADYRADGTVNGFSASTDIVNEFFPQSSTPFGTLGYRLSGHDWADYRYMLKSFQVSVTGPRWIIAPIDPANTSNVRNTLSVGVGSTDGGSWGATSPFRETIPGTEMATYLTTYNLNDATDGTPLGAQFSYTPAAPQAQGIPGLGVASTNGAPLINTAGQYDWKSTGPFVDLTVQITDATEYPTLSSADVMLSPNGTFAETKTVFMLKTSDSLVYEMGATVSGVTAALRFAGSNMVPVQDSHITTTYLQANPSTTQSVLTTGLSENQPLVPDHMSTVYSSATEPGAGTARPAGLPVQWSGSAGLSRPYIAFVAFSGTPCAADTDSSNAHIFYKATVRANLLSAMVECSSHYDCAGQPGNHPSQERAVFSANGDANRFSTCYLYFDATGFGKSKPSTRCMECAPIPGATTNYDLECNQGQFCWVDYGLCDFKGDTYVCDSEANSWIGICRNKSTQVLGKKCRAAATGVVSSVSTTGSAGTGSNIITPIGLGATFRDDTSLGGFAPGAGFCGEVRYFNSTAEGEVFDSNSVPQFGLDGTARTTLWTGSCVAGRCMECNPSSFPNDGSITRAGKTCVNGYLVTPITIDNTARTLVFSAPASGAATTAAFAVLLFFVALCSMQNAGNRHRELYGEQPMGCAAVFKAVTYEWICCLKGETERSRMARFTGGPGTSAATSGAGATAATPLTAPAGSSATVNPLDGKQAQDWGTRA